MKKRPSKTVNRKSGSEKPAWKKALGVFGYVLFLAVVLSVGTIAGWAMKSRMFRALAAQAFQPKPAKEVFNDQDGITMLVLGTDEDRKWGGVERFTDDGFVSKPGTVIKGSARADMILVARLNFRDNTITGISIPRDVYTQVPGYRARKINAYYRVNGAEDGPKHMGNAVEHVLKGVKIDKTIVLNYQAFQEMVDIVGGVPITVDKKMDYDDNAGNVHIHLAPGRHVLNGYDSLMYVRFRKGNSGGGDSDFERQNRQKQFLVSFKNSIMRDPLRLPQVMDKAVEVLGNSLSEDQIASVAYFARGVKPETIKMGQVPVRPGRGTNLLVNERELSAKLVEFNLLPPPKVSRQ